LLDLHVYRISTTLVSSSTAFVAYPLIAILGDGGIHGQLLQNNGFQGNTPGMKAWAPIGGAQISQDTSNPLSSAIGSTIGVSVPGGASGAVGVANGGYIGVPVNNDTYTTSFWYKGAYTGDLTVNLVSNTTGTVFGSSNISVTSGDSFTEYNATIAATQSPDRNNIWQVTLESSEATSFNLGLPQLFPTTYKGW
jgi:alpha-N-arabinofuranosidase